MGFKLYYHYDFFNDLGPEKHLNKGIKLYINEKYITIIYLVLQIIILLGNPLIFNF